MTIQPFQTSRAELDTETPATEDTAGADGPGCGEPDGPVIRDESL
jgi:hypothetical protein